VLLREDEVDVKPAGLSLSDPDPVGTQKRVGPPSVRLVGPALLGEAVGVAGVGARPDRLGAKLGQTSVDHATDELDVRDGGWNARHDDKLTVDKVQIGNGAQSFSCGKIPAAAFSK
jgi:hypothetical protein